MVLKAWWMILVWLIVLPFCWKYFSSKRHVKTNKMPVANSRYLQSLPTYKKALSRYKLMIKALAVVVGLMFGVLLFLSLRPASKSTQTPEFKNRDIVLCLDVSGSMSSTDAKVVEVFSELSKGFKGERIGMVIFDSSSATIFPLTDDYAFITDTLNKTKEAFTNEDYSKNTFDIFTGVNEGDGSSLVGDGLASCVLRFDKLGSKRSRSIILATDNYANGSQIVDIKQAGALAKQKDVRVYGLNPSDYSSGSYTDPTSQEFREVVLSTEGDYYKFSEPGAVAGIIDKISKQEATRFKGTPSAVISDNPRVLLIVAFTLLTTLIIVFWRMGL